MRKRRVRIALLGFAAWALVVTPGWAQAVDDPSDTGGDTPTVSDAPATAESAPVSGDTQTAVAAPSGLSGRVVIQGRCPVPVADDGTTCPDRPFPTTVQIRTSDGQQPVATVVTADDGTFSVALEPGQYLVAPLLSDGRVAPSLASVLVDVPGDQVVPVTIRIHGPPIVRLP
jgi:hypothetical protein